MRSLALAAAAVLALPACFSEEVPSDDVTGPYTGPITRYVVDGFTLPTSTTIAREFADDLNGDKSTDNLIGAAFSALASFKNLTTHAPDMISAGVIESAVEIQADDLSDDPTVRVWYHGTPMDGGEAVGGTLTGGTFVSNRTRTTRVPGTARIALPVFVDADPLVVTLQAMEMDLVPDGKGGFDATIRGGIRGDEVMDETYKGMMQMFRANPADHRGFWTIVDRNHDGVVTEEEVTSQNSLLEALLSPDVTLRLRDGSRETLSSIAFKVHLAPCPDGRCAPAIADRCHDRVLDGDETDLDCGGSCMACGAGARCTGAGDCLTGACNGGSCAAPTCTDAIPDGFEADVDCSGGCGLCGTGKACDFSSDCLSKSCQNGRCS